MESGNMNMGWSMTVEYGESNLFCLKHDEAISPSLGYRLFFYHCQYSFHHYYFISIIVKWGMLKKTL